jgi:streptogramin lyase
MIAILACGWAAAPVTTAQAASLPGTASLAGTVDATRPFTAAQVYLRNLDKRILYMVYTNAGRFRAVALFPGNYEISASAKGLASDVEKLVVNAGAEPKVRLSLRAIAATSQIINTAVGMAGQNNRVDVTLQSYDEIYPPGVGRDVIERTCMVCHGENWLPAQPALPDVWQFRIDRMMGKSLWDRPAQSYAEGLLSYRAQWLRFSLQDRQDLLAYLIQNFGTDAKPRMVRTDKETPIDEAKLGKAMYIEYYVPEDPPGYATHDPQYQGAAGPFSALRTIQDVRFDADGNVWATDRSSPARLVKLDPRTGAWKEWITPHPRSDIHEVIIARDGMIWLPEHAEGLGLRNYLLGFNPKTEKWDYSIDMDPDDVVRNAIKWTDSISIDSKNNMYVNWIMGGALTKIDGAAKQVVGVFPLASTNAIPYGNVVDRNDNVFLALWGRGSIAKFDTHTNTWTEFTPPTFPGEVRRLNVDYQNNVWFGIYSAGSRRAGKLAMLNQTTGRIIEYTIPEQSAQPYDTTADPKGNIWFADTPQVDRSAAIAKFNPQDQTFTFYPKPQFDADTPKIQITKDGAIWYAPRGSLKAPGIGVLYPDMDKIATLGAYYLNGPPGYPFKPVVSTTQQASRPRAAGTFQ